MIGAMADASYKKSVFHVERYQEKVLSKGHEIINHYDKLLEKKPTQESAWHLRQKQTMRWQIW